MRIQKMHIRNLRAIADATVHLDDYICFVGPNGAGKSTVLLALNIFFREVDTQGNPITALSAEDFHRSNTSEPIEITVWFHQLSESAKEDFKDYVRQNLLVVSAKAYYDENTQRAEVKQYGQRLAMSAFSEFFRKHGDKAKVDELRSIYTELATNFDLPRATSGVAMVDALREYESKRPDECELIASEDQFYGASKGVGRLQRHIQWVYVPAVKDASTEESEGKNTALGKLLARTVRSKVNFTGELQDLTHKIRVSYEKLLVDSQAQLEEISDALNARLQQWAHPEASLKLQWHQYPDKAIKIEEPYAKVIAGEASFQGELARFGHGFQRSYLLALLQELAGTSEEAAPTLILGCEEPELYQHPPQARHLASVLQELASTNSQVLVSTHSPLFLAGDNFQNVRLVHRNPSTYTSAIKQADLDVIGAEIARCKGKRANETSGTLSYLHQLLQPQLAEMFFTQRLVFVEGLEDSAYITAWLSLTNQLGSFRRRGVHIVPVGGKSELLRPAILAKHMAIPLYLIFDADRDKARDEKQREFHERDNSALLRFLGVDEKNLFPNEPIWGKHFAIWPENIGALVDSELLETLGKNTYEQIKSKAHSHCGAAQGIKKHTMLIGTKLTLAHAAGGASRTLNQLCQALISF